MNGWFLLIAALLLFPHGALCAQAPGLRPAPASPAAKKTVPEMIAQYRNDQSPGTRYFTIRDLGLSGNAQAVSFLVSLVETGDFEEKRQAIDALAASGSGEAVPVMKRVLEDPGSLSLPVRYKDLAEQARAAGYTAVQVRAINGLLRMGRHEAAYPWIERFIFEKRVNLLSCLVVEQKGDGKEKLAKLAFRDEQARKMALKALGSDDIDISLTAAYYLAENGYVNGTMYRVVDRAWKTVRGNTYGSGAVRGRIVGTLARMQTRKARKKLAEIERDLKEEKRRWGNPAGR